MLIRPSIGLAIEQDEIKGFSRTITEIEWLLLILVLIYLVAGGPTGESRAAIAMALCFFGAFILSLHYVSFYRQESLVKLAIETWVMIIFITWVVHYAGRISSPLLNLYLLPIIASALILGKLMTFIEMVGIAVCFMFLHYDQHTRNLLSLPFWGELLALLAPVILVAYITTMLSADIRFAVDKIKRVSDTDELTGLYNMRAFTMVLSRNFKQAMRYSHKLSIVMLDCDNLKQVNDTHGHESGNRLLQHVARTIRSELRGSDVLATPFPLSRRMLRDAVRHYAVQMLTFPYRRELGAMDAGEFRDLFYGWFLRTLRFFEDGRMEFQYHVLRDYFGSRHLDGGGETRTALLLGVADELAPHLLAPE